MCLKSHLQPFLELIYLQEQLCKWSTPSNEKQPITFHIVFTTTPPIPLSLLWCKLQITITAMLCGGKMPD